jgi:hypothetical protein
VSTVIGVDVQDHGLVPGEEQRLIKCDEARWSSHDEADDAFSGTQHDLNVLVGVRHDSHPVDDLVVESELPTGSPPP